MDFDDTIESEKIFKNLKIFSVLQHEFDAFRKNKPGLVNSYIEFINHMDIGLSYLQTEYYSHDTYKIVDKKKWLIAKLKYGF